MGQTIKSLVAASALLALGASSSLAQVSDDLVKIGALNDMSGVYSASSGPATVEAVKMAIEDFGGSVLGKRIEVVGADHQNKPDIGASIVSKWFDIEKVDAVVDVPSTDVANSSDAATTLEVENLPLPYALPE